jgi:hypothetical protein
MVKPTAVKNAAVDASGNAVSETNVMPSKLDQ